MNGGKEHGKGEGEREREREGEGKEKDKAKKEKGKRRRKRRKERGNCTSSPFAFFTLEPRNFLGPNAAKEFLEKRSII